jgi:hypothetical protein
MEKSKRIRNLMVVHTCTIIKNAHHTHIQYVFFSKENLKIDIKCSKKKKKKTIAENPTCALNTT